MKNVIRFNFFIYLLNHKVLMTIAANDILTFAFFLFIFFLFVFSRENKSWHFMWAICLSDNSYEMLILNFSEKYLKKQEHRMGVPTLSCSFF